MTGATELLTDLRRRGLDLVPVGDRIRFRPKDALPPELRDRVIEYKADLLALLLDEAEQVHWRADVMRPQVPLTGPIPTMYARRLSNVPNDCCLSCGDALTPGNKYRCEPCVRAAWLVLREVRAGV